MMQYGVPSTNSIISFIGNTDVVDDFGNPFLRFVNSFTGTLANGTAIKTWQLFNKERSSALIFAFNSLQLTGCFLYECIKLRVK